MVSTEGRLPDYQLYHLTIQIPLEIEEKCDNVRTFA